MARFRYIYGEHEDVLLGKHQTACIACNADGKTWRLIRLEEDAVIKVNGEDLHLVHYLSSGDRIDLGGRRGDLAFRRKERRFRRRSKTVAEENPAYRHILRRGSCNHIHYYILDTEQRGQNHQRRCQNL